MRAMITPADPTERKLAHKLVGPPRVYDRIIRASPLDAHLASTWRRKIEKRTQRDIFHLQTDIRRTPCLSNQTHSIDHHNG
jgi:hypothetical protein